MSSSKTAKRKRKRGRFRHKEFTATAVFTTCSQNVKWGKSDIPKAGIGVFAAKDFRQGELIEVCYYSLLEYQWDIHPLQASKGYSHLIHPKDLSDTKHAIVRLPTGLSCLYNHSYEPDAKLAIVNERKQSRIEIIALQDISRDQEICIDYRSTNADKTRGF